MQRNYGHVPRWARRLISAIERAPRHRCRASRDVIDHGPWMSYESRPARSRFARGTVPPAFDTDDPTLELEETPTVEIEC